MNESYKRTKMQALEFTARFGFITRNLFFEYLCPLGRTQQFLYWAELLKEDNVRKRASPQGSTHKWTSC